MYAGLSRGDIAKSTDGGRLWLLSNIDESTIISITVDPTDSAVLYVGTDGNGTIQSTDGGNTWRAILDAHLRVTEFAVDAANPSIVYAATHEGLFKTTDRGDSWTLTDLSGSPVFSVVIAPNDTSTVYAGSAGTMDVFVVKVNSTGSAFFYSTLIGGFGSDAGLAVALDREGSAYVTGSTHSTNFPTANAFQSNKQGLADALVFKLDTGQDTTAPAIASASISGKKLIVTGGNFSEGAVVLINDQPQRTSRDEQNPRSVLIAKKGGKKIERGQTVTIRVRNADGTISESLSFTRPI